MTWLTILLLIVSNVFMTFAWYGHLKHHQSSPLWLVVLASWGIAFFEYCFQVPANRLGAKVGLLTAQLKTIQEVVTLVVFVAFATLYWANNCAGITMSASVSSASARCSCSSRGDAN